MGARFPRGAALLAAATLLALIAVGTARAQEMDGDCVYTLLDGEGWMSEEVYMPAMGGIKTVGGGP